MMKAKCSEFVRTGGIPSGFVGWIIVLKEYAQFNLAVYLIRADLPAAQYLTTRTPIISSDGQEDHPYGGSKRV